MTLFDVCGTCGHPRMNHRDHLTAEEKAHLALAPERGCAVDGCDCPAFVEPADATPRLRHANEQQSEVVMRLANVLGKTALMNWNLLPTGLTEGLKFSEMGAAALSRALAALLAGATQHIPDGDPRLEEVLRIQDEILRDALGHMRAEWAVLRTQLEQEMPAPAPSAEPEKKGEQVRGEFPARPVLVPQPKLLM